MSADEYRGVALRAYDRGDWHEIYRWTKGWIGSGGGARMLEPWLLYVISALLHGRPRIAVHSVDLALGHWIAAPADRAVLHWVRGRIVHDSLRDPKTAAADYQAAADQTPDWLIDLLSNDHGRCTSDAARSRKRKPSVEPAPDYVEEPRDFVAEPADPLPVPGECPPTWPQLLATLEGHRLRNARET